MVEFISYDGAYPNLCSGQLRVRIDGEEVVFGTSPNATPQETRALISARDYNTSFWHSGGSISIDNDSENVYVGAWEINESSLRPKYRKYAKELIDIFNENVPYGCCGGCI